MHPDTVGSAAPGPASGMTWTPFQLDSLTQVAVQAERSPLTDQWARGFRHLGQAEVYLPVVLGLLLGGRVFRRASLATAGRRAAISLVVVGLLVTGIKFVTGRVRPKFAASPTEFRPFSGASSFPSGHTGAAFALAGSLALEALPPVGVAMLVGATGTGWSRMNDNKHWLSDVVCGAVLALLTAALVRRRDAHRAAQGGTCASRNPPAHAV